MNAETMAETMAGRLNRSLVPYVDDADAARAVALAAARARLRPVRDGRFWRLADGSDLEFLGDEGFRAHAPAPAFI